MMMTPVKMTIQDQDPDLVGIIVGIEEPAVLEVGIRAEMMTEIPEEVKEDAEDTIGDHMVINGDDTGTETH